jgi:L-seryl-tRNA(Ser) seleniumtransferase
VDKLTLSALEATLQHYLKGEAVARVPVWRMIAAPLEELEVRAQRWTVELEGLGVQVSVQEGESTVGGGSLPGEVLPTWLVAVDVPSVEALARRLRLGEPAVVARVAEGRVLLDPRTVLPEEEGALLEALKEALRD